VYLALCTLDKQFCRRACVRPVVLSNLFNHTSMQRHRATNGLFLQVLAHTHTTADSCQHSRMHTVLASCRINVGDPLWTLCYNVTSSGNSWAASRMHKSCLHQTDLDHSTWQLRCSMHGWLSRTQTSETMRRHVRTSYVCLLFASARWISIWFPFGIL